MLYTNFPFYGNQQLGEGAQKVINTVGKIGPGLYKDLTIKPSKEGFFVVNTNDEDGKIYMLLMSTLGTDFPIPQFSSPSSIEKPVVLMADKTHRLLSVKEGSIVKIYFRNHSNFFIVRKGGEIAHARKLNAKRVFKALGIPMPFDLPEIGGMHQTYREQWVKL